MVLKCPTFERMKEEIFRIASRDLGVTGDIREAGYILPDGTLIDLSGKSEGGSAGMRSYDHREINRVYFEDPCLENMLNKFEKKHGLTESNSSGMILLMNLGAARINFNPSRHGRHETSDLFLDIHVPLSANQIGVIKRLVSSIGKINIIYDLSNESGDKIADGEMLVSMSMEVEDLAQWMKNRLRGDE